MSQGSRHHPLLFSILICVITLMIFLYMLIADISTNFKNIRQMTEILENCFYDNDVVLHSRKCEFVSFGKTNGNEIFASNEIQLKKLLLSNVFFLSGFSFTNIHYHRTAGERGGYLFNSSLPLPLASQALRH